MNDFTTSLISIIFFISMGLAAKKLDLLDVSLGRKLFKFLFAIPLPILVFTSFATNPTETKFLVLPIIGAIIAILLVAVSYLVGSALKLERKTLGALMTASGITSTLSFALPFIIVFYGQDATRYLFLYDFGGAVIVWTFVYYLAGRMGNKHDQSLVQSLKTFLKNPMLLALILGFIVALSGVVFPEVVRSISLRVGNFTTPLILIGIGIFLNLDFFRKRNNLAKIFLGVIIAMGVSVSLAFLLTSIFGITGIIQKVVLICALAPSGALTVPFAAEHELDVEFASALVAATMFFAILLVPILIAL